MNELAWRLHENLASQVHVLAHLKACDRHFQPALSQRVDLQEYVTKLHTSSSRIEAWVGKRLVGLVAMYFDPEGHVAFISNVSVEPNFQCRGIASTLLSRAISTARARQITFIRLHVASSNLAARKIYVKHGFLPYQEFSDTQEIQMQLNLASVS